MNAQLIDGYKRKLETEQGLLLAEIKQSETMQSFGGDTEDPDEGTDKSEEVGNQLAVARDLKNRLSEVNVALEKIRMGKYGICEKCGVEIEKGVLDIDPESRFCKHCKARK